jgi:hypothetical protein
MNRGPFLLPLLLAVSLAAFPAGRDFIGTVIEIDSAQTAIGTNYRIYIECSGRVYIAQLSEASTYQPEWHIGKSINFRVDHNDVFLERTNGQDIEARLEQVSDYKDAANPGDLIHAQSQVDTQAAANPGASDSVGFNVARCADIAAIGDRYLPLARACEFALSSGNLPNFICHEMARRFENNKPLDVVTADVTFLNGRGDHYSNLADNGATMNSWKDVRRGLITPQLFGDQLNTIFLPETKTVFKYKRIVDTPTGRLVVYDYKFEQVNNHKYRIGAVNVGLSGTIWVDQATGQLTRVDARASDLTPPNASYTSSLHYNMTAITGLKPLLAPALGQARLCQVFGRTGQDGAGAETCSENLITFSGCRKFGSTAQILPGFESNP